MKEELNEKELVAVLRGAYLFGDSHSVKILFELQRYGEKNFSQLKTMLDINPSTLTKKLKQLQRAGVIQADHSRHAVKVYYSISAGHAKAVRRFVDGFERLAIDL